LGIVRDHAIGHLDPQRASLAGHAPSVTKLRTSLIENDLAVRDSNFARSRSFNPTPTKTESPIVRDAAAGNLDAIHRVFDGDPAARTLGEAIENPRVLDLRCRP